MIFSSLQYLLFLPVVAFLYWRTSGLARLLLVVVTSYIFYMSWLPIYGIFLFVMTTVNWLLALAIWWAKNKSKAIEKSILVFGLILNLGSLCFYKYTNFLLSNIAYALKLTKSADELLFFWVPAFDAPVLNVIVPLGISFFVFEFVHYLVDVYRGDKPVKSWLDFAAFAAFFPSQIAGPIKRYQDFLSRLHKPEPWTPALFYEAMSLIIQGFFKKVAIADPIASVIASGFVSSHTLSFPDALIASIGFFIQMYCDFAGYTNIGRGSALLLGIRLPENFDLPYLAHDLSDFWRRWHMSLSMWLRDYVYLPLGGSRVHFLINWRNLFITMVACGLWHGADWHYVIFGCTQGIGLIVNNVWRNVLKSVPPLSAICNTWVGKELGTLTTVMFLISTFVLFRAPDIQQSLNVVLGLVNFTDLASTLYEPMVKSGCLYFLGSYLLFWGVLEIMKRRPDLTKLTWLIGLEGTPEPANKLFFPASMRLATWTAAAFLMLAAKPAVPVPFVYFQF